MLDHTYCNIEKLSVHHVENKTNEGQLIVSPNTLDTSDDRLRELLIQYFITPFVSPEMFCFTFTNGDFSLNPLFVFATAIFDSVNSFHFNTVNMAKHLYELSLHPQIKSGDLFIVYFKDLAINHEMFDAIGIFKSENKQSFLKLDTSSGNFSLNYDDGINIEKMDKGCIIFNKDKEAGYQVQIVDKASKGVEAQFWRETFLMVKPVNDNFQHTKQLLDITKNFVAGKLPEEFEITRAEQISLLNKSIDYFKTHDAFDKEEFEQEVFESEQMINSFKKFDETYRQEKQVEIEDNFQISAYAVKKQSKNFKSILKLDKNFHIYIHGDHELIEKGVERDGRKYYKIYYEEEN